MDCPYFLYLYPCLAYRPWIVAQERNAGQSPQLGNPLPRQQTLIRHFANLMSRWPLSYPILQPEQTPDR